jgi:hypothetical protein
MFQLQGFPCFSNNFSMFWLHSFPVLFNIFSLFNLQGFPFFTKKSYLQEFPCISYNYRVFPALIAPFPCFGNIVSCLVYRVTPVLLTIQIYRDFPVLVRTFYGLITGVSLL